MLTQEQLKEILHYDPATGIFTRIAKTSNCVTLGQILNCKRKDGYIRISVLNKRYFAQRLAWLYIHGLFPKDIIDHINRIKDDNRLVNLREATHSQNNCNVPTKKNNTSGITGVDYAKNMKKWRARISINNIQTIIGYYDTKKQAIKARKEAEPKYHKEFAKN